MFIAYKHATAVPARNRKLQLTLYLLIEFVWNKFTRESLATSAKRVDNLRIVLDILDILEVKCWPQEHN